MAILSSVFTTVLPQSSRTVGGKPPETLTPWDPPGYYQVSPKTYLTALTHWLNIVQMGIYGRGTFEYTRCMLGGETELPP